jgi:hypothetical protein
LEKQDIEKILEVMNREFSETDFNTPSTWPT